jgi:hypothetical protein
MTITAPPDTTTVGHIIDLLAASRAGDVIAAVESAETAMSPKDAHHIAGEAELPRVLEVAA